MSSLELIWLCHRHCPTRGGTLTLTGCAQSGKSEVWRGSLWILFWGQGYPIRRGVGESFIPFVKRITWNQNSIYYLCGGAWSNLPFNHPSCCHFSYKEFCGSWKAQKITFQPLETCWSWNWVEPVRFRWRRGEKVGVVRAYCCTNRVQCFDGKLRCLNVKRRLSAF